MTNPASSEPKPRSRNPWKVAGIVFLVVCGIFAVLFLTGSLTLSFDDDNTEATSVQENVADGDCPEYIVDGYWPETMPTDCVPQLVYSEQSTVVTTTLEVLPPTEGYGFDRICEVTPPKGSGVPAFMYVHGAVTHYRAAFPFTEDVSPVIGQIVRVDYVTETTIDGNGYADRVKRITKISPAPADEAGDIQLSSCFPPPTSDAPMPSDPFEPTTPSAEPTN